MPTRAMIVVGGGSSTRFGADKLMAKVDGLPLIAYTIDAVVPHVDTCVVACRPETIEAIQQLRPDVVVTPGGETRTLSEMAGLASLGGEHDLIGVHDAARPLVSGDLIDRLFQLAEEHGGALPTLEPERMLLDRRAHRPLSDLRLAQTPQVFRGPELMTAHVRAAQAGYDGQDTVEIVQRFSGAIVVSTPGDLSNLKVTFPEDLDQIEQALTSRSHT